MLVETRSDVPRISRLKSSTAIARVAGRKTVRSGLGWGLVFGLYVAVQALAYATSYKTAAARRLLVYEFGSNVGISALVGPARQIGTVPGYTAWKCLTVLAITGAVWGILTSTRLMRGEEDAGRWEMLLAGHVTRRGAAAQALVGFAAGAVALFATTAIVAVAVGRSSKIEIGFGGAIYFALAIVAGAVMFLAVGAMCSQLASSRRQAAGYASAFLGASYAIRMVADSSTGLGWLRWATPLGWVEDMQPLTRPDPLALVPISILIVAVGVLIVFLAGRRDLGSSVFPDRSTARAHLRLLNSPSGLALRLMRPTLLGWAAAIIAYGLLLGGIAKSGGKIITSSPSLRLVFARLGVTGSEAFLGLALLIMAIALSFIAVGQIGAARKEESVGQLENLLVRPVSRVSWLTSRVALATGLLLLGGLVVGLSTWMGAASDHAGVSFSTMLGAGLNTVPPALALLGIGVMTFGLVPRAAVALTYAAMVWSLLVEITGGIAGLNHWILDSSLFHQMAAAPSVSVDWSANAIMFSIGAAAAMVGVVAFTHRDLKGE